MKHLFIINPAAGKTDQTVSYTKRIAAYCKPNGLDYEIKVSAYKGNCTELAREAAQTGEEYRIYACGGDGTLNEIVCGVIGTPNVAVTHCPGGSGNDFIRMFGDFEAFSDLARLADGEETLMDVIKVGDLSYGLNICSMGVDARIVADMPKLKHIPLLSGSGAYNVSTALNLVKGLRRPFEIELDGKTLVGDQTLIAVCSGRFYGGGFCPVPDAEPDDGLLDVLAVKGVGRLTAAKVVGAYKQGRYREMPELMLHERVTSVTIRSPQDCPINVDGELLTGRDVTFSVAPEKLRFFHPKGLDFHAKAV